MHEPQWFCWRRAATSANIVPPLHVPPKFSQETPFGRCCENEHVNVKVEVELVLEVEVALVLEVDVLVVDVVFVLVVVVVTVEELVEVDEEEVVVVSQTRLFVYIFEKPTWPFRFSFRSTNAACVLTLSSASLSSTALVLANEKPVHWSMVWAVAHSGRDGPRKGAARCKNQGGGDTRAGGELRVGRASRGRAHTDARPAQPRLANGWRAHTSWHTQTHADTHTSTCLCMRVGGERERRERERALRALPSPSLERERALRALPSPIGGARRFTLHIKSETTSNFSRPTDLHTSTRKEA